MNILIISQYFWPEPFRVNDIAKALLANGHKVTVLTGIPNYPEGEFYRGYHFFKPMSEDYEGIKVYRVPLIARGKSKGILLFLNFLSFMISASILGPILCRGKVDKIFVFQVSPVTVIFPAIVMKFVKRSRLYVWVMDLWPETLVATGVLKSKKILKIIDYFVRFLYRFTDKILVPSKGFIGSIESQNVSSEKIIYWPQWGEEQLKFSKEKFPDRQSLGIPKGFVILFAGNVGTSQSFETIIEAATQLKEEKHIQWIILGDGLKRKWLEKEIERRQLNDCFHLLGRRPIEEMPIYYSYASALLISLNDSPVFSLTIPGKTQSCLASGRPILASINGETAKLIKEAKCGISCEASNAEALVKGVRELANMENSQLDELGKNAEEYFAQNFSRDLLLAKLEEIFVRG